MIRLFLMLTNFERINLNNVIGLFLEYFIFIFVSKSLIVIYMMTDSTFDFKIIRHFKRWTQKTEILLNVFDWKYFKQLGNTIY